MTHADLFAFLRAHCRDAGNVTPLPTIAAALAPPGAELTPARLKSLSRQVQSMLEECAGIDGPDVVCSSCGRNPGLFITSDPAQMLGMVRQLQSRGHRDLARSEKIIRRHPSLRPVRLQRPPRSARPSAAAVTAQGSLFAP